MDRSLNVNLIKSQSCPASSLCDRCCIVIVADDTGVTAIDGVKGCRGTRSVLSPSNDVLVARLNARKLERDQFSRDSSRLREQPLFMSGTAKTRRSGVIVVHRQDSTREDINSNALCANLVNSSPRRFTSRDYVTLTASYLDHQLRILI